MNSNPDPASARPWAGLQDQVAAAAAYYVAGLLGLALVDPLGVSSVLWPAVGVAVVLVLVRGYHVCLGLFVAAFLIAAYAPTWLYAPGGVPVPAALGIALGNVSHALLAAFLIRRLVGWPNRLIDGRDVFTFLLLAGPLGAVAGATVSVGALHYAGVVSKASFAFSWWSWWIGNTLGAVLVAPLLLVPFGKPRDLWRGRARTLALPFVFSVLLVTVLLAMTARWESSRAVLDFERRAVQLEEAFLETLAHSLDVLYSLESFVKTMDGPVDGVAFRQFARERLSRYPGIQGVGWNDSVTDAQREQLVREMRDAGYTDFSVTERLADGTLAVASRRNEYVVVRYLAPFVGNEAALGYDVLSNPLRRDALVAARDEGVFKVTAPIRLVQEKGEQSGVLAVLPVYDGPGRNLEGRRASLSGYVVVVLRLGDLLSTVTSATPDAGLAIRLLDETPGKEPMVLAESCQSVAGGPCSEADKQASVASPDFDWRSEAPIGGRIWTLRVLPTAGYFARTRQWSAWLAPAGSVLLALLTAGFLLMLSGRTAIDVERRRQLESKNTELERFTYAVSHDLKSPLITIRGFLELLDEDIRSADEVQAKNDIARIDRAAGSMMETLDGLLALSRLGRLVDMQERVDMNAVVQDALQRLEGCLGGVEVTVVNALPDASGDPVRLVEVFQNLIENAAKFMGGQRAPRIEIGARRLGDEQAYFVRDNGVGLPADSSERVFGAFERLNPDIAGTGLGLATVRRIVELHGGRVWLDSQGQGEGCTAWVVLPEPGARLAGPDR